MKNNDLMDEDYGKDMPGNQAPWFVKLVGAVITGCVAYLIICLTARVGSWLLP